MARIKSIYTKKELKAVTRGSFVAVKRKDGSLENVVLLKDLDVDGHLTPVLNSNFQGEAITAEQVFAILGGRRLEFDDLNNKEDYDFTEDEVKWAELLSKKCGKKAKAKMKVEIKVWPFISLKKQEKVAKKAAKISK